MNAALRRSLCPSLRSTWALVLEMRAAQLGGVVFCLLACTYVIVRFFFFLERKGCSCRRGARSELSVSIQCVLQARQLL